MSAEKLNKRMADTSAHGHIEMMDKFKQEFEKIFVEEAVIKLMYDGGQLIGKVEKNTISKSEQVIYQTAGFYRLQLRNPFTQFSNERERAMHVSITLEGEENYDITSTYILYDTEDENGAFYQIDLLFRKEGALADLGNYAHVKFTISKVTNTEGRDLVVLEG
jgi:hypothetical protein